ncbi:hypothetical protein [Winogradskyella sp. R77965]|uniref:hypothetical protein n=1 Tax=Winogradskyella sp. R77965 TaxID=3093872 RepID=UPI0037DD9B08
MNKVIIALVLLIGLNLNAQKKSKEEVIDLMAEDTCECITKKKIKTSATMDEKQMALGLCLIKSYNNHKSKSKYFSEQKTANFEKIGEEVGLVMATKCGDEFLSIFSSEELVDFIDDEEEDIIGFKSSDDDKLTIEVELLSMNNDAISYIETKDDFEKNHIFLITEKFEGYELLKKSNFGQSFMISFKEVELFDLSEKQYITKKVITKLEAL